MLLSQNHTFGQIRKGIIKKYDEASMTACIEPDGLGGVINNVVCPFDRFDPKNNAYSFRAPSENAPCLFTTIDNRTYLLELVPPMNLTDEGMEVKNSSTDAIHNYTPDGWPSGKTVKPGEVTDTNANGSEDTFTDTMKKIIIVPNKLSSLWNYLNCIWENVCLIFRLKSGPLDVLAEVNKDDECNTAVKVRKVMAERKEDATTMIDLRMGNDADIIQLNINGKPFLHVDGDRNVILIAKQIDVNAEQINYNVKNESNFLNVETVRLP